MGKVALEGLEFFAYHGFHEEERTIGNRYGVDIVVETDFSEAASHDRLDNTIDYSHLYEVIREEMQHPSQLLEHVGQRMIDRIFASFPAAFSVQITVSKFNPPIGGICHRAYIELKQEKI